MEKAVLLVDMVIYNERGKYPKRLFKGLKGWVTVENGETFFHVPHRKVLNVSVEEKSVRKL